MPDLTFMVHHLISGFLSVTAALVLYYIILYMIGKKLPVAHIAISLIFCLYLTGILAATGICIRASFSPNFTFIPFVDMIRGPIGTALNILLFVPMGFFIPMLYKNYDTISKTALAGFLISLSVECLQMFGFGATDINDLITNTIIYVDCMHFLVTSWFIPAFTVVYSKAALF